MAVRLWLSTGLAIWIAGCTCGQDTNGDPPPDGTTEAVTTTTARIVHVEGNVRIKRVGSMEWIDAQIDLELSADDKLRTLRESFATIEFVHGGGSLRVGPESLVSVTDLRVEQRTQARRFTFTLVEGKVEAELEALTKDRSEFKIRTPSAEASVLRREVEFQ